MNRTFTLILIAYSLFFSVNAYSQQTEDCFARLDSLLQAANPRKFNGVILITQNDKTLYSKVVGYADFDLKTPLTLKDKFRIQSNSKQITAVLILREVEKGNLALEKSVKHYLPELQQPWADSVTLHQLLNMSAGIVGLNKPLAFKPGTGFYYSNPAYGLLGKVLEKVTGKKFTAAANALFQELEMQDTYCYEMNGTNAGLVNGHWATHNSVEVVKFQSMNFTDETWSNFIPGGGVISTAPDLNTWDTKLHTGKILQSQSYTAMVNSNVVDADYTFSHTESNYGYGVNINQDKPVKYMGHAGRGMGFVSLKFYIPAKNLDVIILENTYDRDPNTVYHFEKNIREIILNSELIR